MTGTATAEPASATDGTAILRAAQWRALGCDVRVVVAAPRDLAIARELLAVELEAIDRACSRFRPDSELVRLDDAGGRSVPVSPLLAQAVEAALVAARGTDGDVDPTVGSAMAALGYDRDFDLVRFGPGTDTGLDSGTGTGTVYIVERPVPGWRRIVLDRKAGTLQVPVGIRLDLGATAKALAADRAAAAIGAVLDGRGALVSLGGDIATTGSAPEGGWRVRVQDITGNVETVPDGPTQVIGLLSGAIATSSTSARRWVRGGRVMHHILDPRTGVPVASTWRTVTVAAPTCLAANIASTASIVRGRSAVTWLAGRGLAARLVHDSGVVTELPGWPQGGPVTR